jgi:hypothetical protein
VRNVEHFAEADERIRLGRDEHVEDASTAGGQNQPHGGVQGEGGHGSEEAEAKAQQLPSVRRGATGGACCSCDLQHDVADGQSRRVQRVQDGGGLWRRAS